VILAEAAESPWFSGITWVPFVTGLAALAWYALRRIRRSDPLAIGRAPESPWGWPEALAVLLLWMFLQVAGYSIAARIEAAPAWKHVAGLAASLPVALGVLLVWGLAARQRGAAPGEKPGVSRLRGAGVGLLVWLGGFPLLVLLTAGWAGLLDSLGRPWVEQSILVDLRARPVPFLLGAVVLAPFCEEVVFRGVVYGALRRHLGKGLAIPLSAAFFAGVHFYLHGALPLFVLGMLLAWTYERTGTLVAPIAFHAAFNGWTFVEQAVWPQVGG
jgi:membrane protease YdiL (CAAX protease family)